MKFRKNTKGFSLIEVLIATALLTIVGTAMMTSFQMTQKDSLQLRAVRVIATARAQIEAALKNPVSWRQTVAKNSTFACTNDPAGCNVSAANNGYYDFVLYAVTTGEKVTYDPGDPRTRYGFQGGACPAGVPDHDGRCPLKYMARWKPLCQTYPCTNPTLDIKISLVSEFDEKSGPPLNTQKYEYTTVRGVDDGSLQSACQILNGTYNVATGTCYPKYSGRSCASLGKPAQIITGVQADGNITCAPLYTGQCNPSTQVMNGISSSGAAQCATRTQPANCPKACVGAWGPCSASCGGGTRTYSVVSPATNGGAACTTPLPGSTQSCNTQACPQNCVGSWSACSQSCGGGTKKFSVSTPATNGGASCAYNSGDTIACNTEACALPVDCAGSWSACNPVSGTKSFTITQAPQNGGKACPAQLTQSCAVDCVGSWGSCGGSPKPFRTFTWTTLPKNGGTSSTCAYANGQTDSSACAPPTGRYQCYNSGGGAPEVSCSGRAYICAADDKHVSDIEASSCTVGDVQSFTRGCDDCSSQGISGGNVICECSP